MFKHLLIPLDLRRDVESLLDAAQELALELKARVSLLHVIEEIEDFDDVEMRSFYERLERRAHRRLEITRRRFADAGLEAALEIRLGRRIEEILRFTQEGAVDLVVMRSRGMTQPPSGSWPTISIQIATLSPVPVLLLRGPAPQEPAPEDQGGDS